ARGGSGAGAGPGRGQTPVMGWLKVGGGVVYTAYTTPSRVTGRLNFAVGWGFMLRAALIGLPSSGKTTLFQLMTSIHEAPRGKGDVNIGISKVPDERLDRLTAMYNPKKHVPATVEFTDIVAAARGGAQALVDVAGYKNADALVHVVRAFRDPSVAHPSGSIDPARDAQTMEDELILADLGVIERRQERLEKDLKKGRSPDLEREGDLVRRCRAALEDGKPLRALELTGD